MSKLMGITLHAIASTGLLALTVGVAGQASGQIAAPKPVPTVQRPALRGVTTKPVLAPQGPDLAVTMTGPATASQGQGVAFSLTVKNNDASATAVNIQVRIPNSGVALSSYAVPGSYCNIGGGATCFISTLAAGASVAFTVSGVAMTVGKTTTTATVSADTGDSNPANNSASAITTVNPGADLAVTMTGPAQVVGPAWAFAYNVTVRNLGPGSAVNAVLDDDLPNALDYGNAKATTSTGTCTVKMVVGPNGGATNYEHVHCDLGTMPTGATATIAINGGWNGGGPSGPVTNTATVSSSNGDTATANNTAKSTGTFGPADVAVVLSGPATAVFAKDFVYTVTLSNAGPQEVSRTDLYLSLSGMNFVSASWPSCGSSSGQIYCYRDGLKAGQSDSVTVKLISTKVGYATIAASTSLQNAYETNAANNKPSQTVSITAQ
jgi:hypothetical protein